MNLAVRIRARAIQRCGVLLRQIARKEQAGRPLKNGGSGPPISRSQAARDAGLSRDQKRTALRVANVPPDEFEDAVESDDPYVGAMPTTGTVEPLNPPRRGV